MQWKRVNIFSHALVIFCVAACHKPASMIKEIKLLQNYPSGSGLAWLNDKLYLMGDDVGHVLVIDKNLNVVDSIPLLQSDGKRIEKSVKPDLEAIAVIRYRKKTALMFTGSGSKDPYRNLCVILDPVSKEKKEFDLGVFYQRLRDAGLKDLNIEGATAIPEAIVFASRGNKSQPRNYLVFTDNNFFDNQDSAEIKVVVAGTNKDTAVFNGISGLEYSPKSDKLIMSVSTEDTYDSYADGTIGKSYLWIIDDISTRKRFTAVNPDRIIDLEEIDKRFAGHKIESVCIISETGKEMELVLAADDDKGETLLFKILLEK